MSKYNLNFFIDYANKKKGRCLSKRFSGMKSKIIIECHYKHQWLASPRDLIYSNSWCPVCSRNKKYNKRYAIEDAKKIAEEKNGKCLSEEYVNCVEKLLWECEEGHKWWAPFSRIKNEKRWCPYCANCAKYTIEDAKELAKERGGECLSEVYKNSHTYLLWKCKNGHQWKAKFYLVKNLKNWCRKCSGSQKRTIQEMKNHAITRNGKCLSNIYKDNKNKLLWECEEGHQWKAKPNIILRGSWCPQCSKWKTQKKLYNIVCEIFDKKNVEFNYRGFNWLKVPDTGYKMEIDIFVKDKKLAIEYHGEQHYRPIQYFGGQSNFCRIQFRDKIKKELLEEHNDCINDFIIFNNKDKIEYSFVKSRLQEWL